MKIFLIKLLQTGRHPMNRIDFICMINDYERINSQNIEDIKEVIDLYPYFQSAHLLLLKALHNSSDIKFAGQLNLSSAHIANREILYYLLNPISDKVVNIEIKNNTGEINLSPEGEKNHPVKTREELIEEIEKRLQEIKGTEHNIIDHGLQELPVDSQQSLVDEKPVFEIDNEGSFIIEDLPVADNVIEVSSKADLLNFEYNIEEYINNSPENKEQKTISDNELEEISPSEKEISQAELIDKFILANPRIEPVKDKSEIQVSDISKPVNDEKGSFITETLARIYIKQEYYSRAIDIYEKLSLKFPEKSSYFAAQIEKIKELIKPK